MPDSLFVTQMCKSNNIAWYFLLFSETEPDSPCAWSIIYALHRILIPFLNMLHFRNFNYRQQHEEKKKSNACLLQCMNIIFGQESNHCQWLQKSSVSRSSYIHDFWPDGHYRQQVHLWRLLMQPSRMDMYWNGQECDTWELQNKMATHGVKR